MRKQIIATLLAAATSTFAQGETNTIPFTDSGKDFGFNSLNYAPIRINKETKRLGNNKKHKKRKKK